MRNKRGMAGMLIDPETAVGWRGPYVMNGAINFFPVDGVSGILMELR